MAEQPLTMAPNTHRGMSDMGPTMRFFGASAATLARPQASFDVATRLRFTGAERIAILPYGRTSTVEVTGDWPDPSFNGGFLPTDQRVSDSGFRANWSVPFIARGVADSGSPELISRLGGSDLGVSFVEPANAYQSVSRSLKYAVLFVGLVFLTFFVFEVTTGRRVHPAQYVLVGLAQIIFYLLLLAIAEHLGFDLGFLIAAIATVLLISAYAQWTFDSRRQGIRALIVFALLYGGIYVLMRLEDYALLVGAIASFLAIAAVMWFTRRIDWYGLTETSAPAPRARPVDFGQP
jgi:inner membrane protein